MGLCFFVRVGPRDQRIAGQIGLQEGCWRRGMGATSCWKVQVRLLERRGGGRGGGGGLGKKHACYGTCFAVIGPISFG